MAAPAVTKGPDTVPGVLLPILAPEARKFHIFPNFEAGALIHKNHHPVVQKQEHITSLYLSSWQLNPSSLTRRGASQSGRRPAIWIFLSYTIMTLTTFM